MYSSMYLSLCRKMFLSKKYYENPNIIKFNALMNTFNVEKNKRLVNIH